MSLATRYAERSGAARSGNICGVERLKRRLNEEDLAWFLSVEYDDGQPATFVSRAVRDEFPEYNFSMRSLQRHRIGECACRRRDA